MGVWLYRRTFLTLTLEGEFSVSHPCSFTPKARTPGARCIGDWVGPIVGMYAVEKRRLLHCRKPNLGHFTCSQPITILSELSGLPRMHVRALSGRCYRGRGSHSSSQRSSACLHAASSYHTTMTIILKK